MEDLLDPYDPEPLDQRPLQYEGRERILRAWIDTREERPNHLTVELPAEQRDPDLARRLEAAVRRDLAATYEASKHLRVFTRGERREAWIAFCFLAVTLVASSLIGPARPKRACDIPISSRRRPSPTPATSGNAK